MSDTLLDLATVALPPDAKVDRLGFWQAPGPGGAQRGHLVFVPELATEPGQVAMEMVEERAKERGGE